ncbi:ABC transporter permease [Streptomyces sp. NPDC004288]
MLSEALAGVLQRPGRSALTSLGTILGVGSFVAVLGLTTSASSQIDARFNALTATEVTVTDMAQEADEYAAEGFPQDAEKRLAAVNGVRAGGVFWTVRLPQGTQVRSAPVSDLGAAAQSADLNVVAASPGMLKSAQPTLAEGRLFDAYAMQYRQPVALLGAGAARSLGITTLETRPAVYIGDQAFTVVGIVSDVRRKADVLLSVILPHTVARQMWGPPDPGSAEMLITTDLGAAHQVASEVPVALRPDHPEYLKATPPPEPKVLRAGVGGDLNQLFLVLAGICLVIGAVGIANTTLVAVLERTGEIGLRRALGARGRHVTLQFLAESGALGALGGLAGTSVGTTVVVAVAMWREWTPVLHPATVAAGPFIGLVTGVVAGLYPAWRASRIEPAEALRR